MVIENSVTNNNDFAEEHTEQHTNAQITVQSQTTTMSSSTIQAEVKKEGEGKFEFNELFSELANEHGFVIGSYKVFDLPMIFYDDKLGFHYYNNSQDVMQSGLFTLHEKHPVRTSDGQKPTLDLSITNLVCFQWMAMFILFFVFKMITGKYKKRPNKAPSGVQNLVEFWLFDMVRDRIVRPNVGSSKVANRLFLYFGALYFFIFVVNTLGLIPGGHTSTGAIGTTAGLAIISFFVINWTSIKEIGIGNYLKHLLGGAPIWLSPILVPIEILSMFTKPFALTIRLFANMTAGHVILLSLIGLIFYFGSIAIAPISMLFSIFIYFLECLVVFLHAYIFTTLTAVFVGLAVGDHAEHHAEHA